MDHRLVEIKADIIGSRSKGIEVFGRRKRLEPRLVTRQQTSTTNILPVVERSKNESCGRLVGRLAPLAGASHVKQLFVYLSYPAGQTSSAISGTRSSSSSPAVTTRTPCASTSVLASAPRSRITGRKEFEEFLLFGSTFAHASSRSYGTAS